MNAVVEQKEMPAPAVVDDVIARGDLSKLTPEQRVVHYNNVCQSLGLNPLTQPFQYVTLNGRLVLYTKKDGTDQLRKLNGINIEVVSRSVQGDLLTVHVRAIDKTGRRDEDFGAVSVAGLRGEAAANAMMKAVTKAKRRVTLSISGLGFSDETEVEDIPSTFDKAEIAAGPHMLKDMPPEPTVEVEPYELEHNENSEDEWKRWGNDLFAYIKAAKTFDRIDEWIVANGEGFEALKHYDVGKFNRLRHMIQAVQDAKAKAAKDDA